MLHICPYLASLLKSMADIGQRCIACNCNPDAICLSAGRRAADGAHRGSTASERLCTSLWTTWGAGLEWEGRQLANSVWVLLVFFFQIFGRYVEWNRQELLLGVKENSPTVIIFKSINCMRIRCLIKTKKSEKVADLVWFSAFRQCVWELAPSLVCLTAFFFYLWPLSWRRHAAKKRHKSVSATKKWSARRRVKRGQHKSHHANLHSSLCLRTDSEKQKTNTWSCCFADFLSEVPVGQQSDRSHKYFFTPLRLVPLMSIYKQLTNLESTSGCLV